MKDGPLASVFFLQMYTILRLRFQIPEIEICSGFKFLNPKIELNLKIGQFLRLVLSKM